uniref:RING-type domain-containing protein n=1 Tax=viral metagenome TaxID=1070528 RepID=A0A6C0CTI3_9ZZZZ
MTEPLRQSILPYRYWKKYIKIHKDILNPNEIVATLDQQCKEAEQQFIQELYINLYHPKSFFKCCSLKPRVYPYDISHELIQFSEINRLTLYKICKKLQKNGASNLLQYYSNANYKFIASHELQYLKMKKQNPKECPICFEENANPYIILDCEHYMCLSCVLKMTNTETINATIYNKLYIGLERLKQCPFCRKAQPLTNISKYHFYPNPPK